MTTEHTHDAQRRKRRGRRFIVAAIAAGLLAPAAAQSSVASAATTPSIKSQWSSVFAAGGTSPVQGISVQGWESKKVLVAVGAIATGSPASKAFLRSSFVLTGSSTFGWAYKSDPATQTSSNDGRGLETLQFYGTQSEVNGVLRDLQVTTTADTKGLTIKAMATEYQEGLIYLPKVEHFYKFVSTPLARANGVRTANTTAATWDNAKSAAEAATAFGQPGYLATITSVDENDYVTSRTSPDGLTAARNVWIGGRTIDTNYSFKWSGGPEKDVEFYKGCEPLETVRTGSSATYHSFVDGEPNNWKLNDLCSTTTLTESCVLTNRFVNNKLSLGGWNDMPCSYSSSEGYVIEYGNKPVGGDFVGVYTTSKAIARAVPATKPRFLETLARPIGKVTAKVLSSIKVSLGGKLVTRKKVQMKAQVQVLKAGTYRVFVQAPISKPGLKIRAGSKVNGIALNTTAKDFYERNTFVLKKDARKVTFDIRIDSPKRGADKPSLVLVKLEKRSDGSLKFVRQQIPSNWKIALRG